MFHKGTWTILNCDKLNETRASRRNLDHRTQPGSVIVMDYVIPDDGSPTSYNFGGTVTFTPVGGAVNVTFAGGASQDPNGPAVSNVTMSYANTYLGNHQPETEFHGGNGGIWEWSPSLGFWVPLDNCAVNTTGETVMCSTSSGGTPIGGDGLFTIGVAPPPSGGGGGGLAPFQSGVVLDLSAPIVAAGGGTAGGGTGGGRTGGGGSGGTPTPTTTPTPTPTSPDQTAPTTIITLDQTAPTTIITLDQTAPTFTSPSTTSTTNTNTAAANLNTTKSSGPSSATTTTTKMTTKATTLASNSKTSSSSRAAHGKASLLTKTTRSPIVSNLTVATNGSEPLLIILKGYEPNANSSIIFSIVFNPTLGHLSKINGATTIYTPNPRTDTTTPATDTFTYRARDSSGLVSNMGIVKIRFNPQSK